MYKKTPFSQTLLWKKELQKKEYNFSSISPLLKMRLRKGKDLLITRSMAIALSLVYGSMARRR